MSETPVLKIREIQTVLHYFIGEDQFYNNHLCKGDLEISTPPKPLKELSILSLWKVVCPAIIPDGTRIGNIETYVLAVNEERAIGQFLCKAVFKEPQYMALTDLELQNLCSAVQVPFMIQGWSAQEF